MISVEKIIFDKAEPSKKPDKNYTISIVGKLNIFLV
jgi:hypothetical protein